MTRPSFMLGKSDLAGYVQYIAGDSLCKHEPFHAVTLKSALLGKGIHKSQLSRKPLSISNSGSWSQHGKLDRMVMF